MVEIDPNSYGEVDAIVCLYPSRIGVKQFAETRVQTCTGSNGILTGTVSGNASLFKAPGAQNFQEMWIVRLDGILSECKRDQNHAEEVIIC